MSDSAYVLGVDLTNTFLSASALPFAQGEAVKTKNGQAILVQAQSAITKYDLVVYAPSSAAASASVDAFPASLTNVSGRLFAVAQVAIAKSAYGWVHTEANKEGRIRAAAMETGVVPCLTGTGGVIDDAGTSGKQLAGVWVLESVTSASAPRAIWRDIKLDRDQLA